MIFESRETAASQLLHLLGHYKGQGVIVAGVPRGAMPMARILADALGAELTAVLVRKIPSYNNPELAIGCVGLSGQIQNFAHGSEPEGYIEHKAKEEMTLLRKRREEYQLAPLNYRGKTIILVDDGIATGATTSCAVQELRSYHPKKIILATPVSSDEAAELLRPLVDHFVCLHIASDMYAISQYYQHFGQVSDQEVVQALRGGSMESDGRISMW